MNGLVAAVFALGCNGLLGIDGLPPSGGAAGDGGRDPSGSGSGGGAGRAPLGREPLILRLSAGGAAGPLVPVPPQEGSLLGEPCSEPDGALRCTTASVNLVLRCDRDVDRWVRHETCLSMQRCDPLQPGCRALDDVDAACWERASDGPTCVGSQVIDCGPSVTRKQTLDCPFGCQDGACLPGNGDQVLIHADSGELFRDPWPARIPVCFRAPEDGDHERWLVDEVERRFARFFDLTFSGFGACEGEPAGVIVELEDACAGRLVNAANIGYPGEGAATLVQLCRSALGPEGAEIETEESLFRLLVRHQFAHVLGLRDGVSERQTMLLRGISRPRADALTPTTADMTSLFEKYPRKPENSLVTPSGRCLSVTNEIEIEAAVCSEVAPIDREWEIASDTVRQIGRQSDRCIQSVTRESDVVAETTGCPVAQSDVSRRWQLLRAQWRSGDLCVTARPEAGAALFMAPCGPVGQREQSWFLEIILSEAGAFKYRVILHHASSNLCVASPFPVEPGAPLHLAECVPTDGDAVLRSLQDAFWLSGNGQIHFVANLQIYRVRWPLPLGAVHLDQIVPPAEALFIFSGSLEGSGGTNAGKALTLSPEQRLVVAPLADPPTPDQVFDAYF